MTAGTENTTPVAPGQTLDGPVIVPGIAGVLETVIHLGALMDDPPHESAAVTHNCAAVNPAGNVTCTLVVPCPAVIGAVDPPKVQLYTAAPADDPHV